MEIKGGAASKFSKDNGEEGDVLCQGRIGRGCEGVVTQNRRKYEKTCDRAQGNRIQSHHGAVQYGSAEADQEAEQHWQQQYSFTWVGPLGEH